MNGLEKKEFHRTLAYFWPLYLVIPAIACFALTYLMHATHLPKQNEQVNLFIACSSLDSNSLKGKMEASLKEKGAKAANLIYANPNDASFGQKLAVVGYHQADLFLLPQSVLEKLEIGDVFLPFRPGIKENWVRFASPEYYVHDTLDFGLKIHEKGSMDGLSSDIGFLEEDYYLCLNLTSVNLGDLGIYDIPEDDLGLEAFAYLQEVCL